MQLETSSLQFSTHNIFMFQEPSWKFFFPPFSRFRLLIELKRVSRPAEERKVESFVRNTYFKSIRVTMRILTRNFQFKVASDTITSEYK